MHFTCAISILLLWPSLLAQAHAAKQHAGDFSWVAGVNYVPSTAHNDVATWQDYDEVQVETELGYAAAAGFNAVRVFLHSLPWLFNATAFNARLAHFIATAEVLNLTSQLVLFDSCFGDVNADLSWITTGRYKNATWIPNPGPLAVANTSSWPLYDEYAINVLRVAGSSRAIFVWDIMNEPAFSDGPSVVDFIAHMSALVAANDAIGRPRTVGIASSSQQALVQEHVSMLSFHNYNGGGAGAALAQDIAGQQALGAQLGLPVLLTESMSRPADPLSGVLPAVYGCFNGSSKAERIGWWVGPDRFSSSPPHYWCLLSMHASLMRAQVRVGAHAWCGPVQQRLAEPVPRSSVPELGRQWTRRRYLLGAVRAGVARALRRWWQRHGTMSSQSSKWLVHPRYRWDPNKI